MMLRDKTALILGASRGIGAATAKAFVANGARVVLAARDREALEKLAAELGDAARIMPSDMTKPDEIAAAVNFTVKNFGRLDVAYNNAGVSPPRALFADLSDDAFDAAMNVNLRGAFIAMKHEIRAMLANGGGAIVNTGSIGSTIGMPQMAAYVASKHALFGLTKTAALDYARRNIRVNMVAPGPTMTEMLKKGAAATAEGRAMVEGATPMGRIAQAEEVAGAVVYLCSDVASYVTGTILTVDGGYTVG
jgi:NAD(P)-dependent dehydrogenase (short-subunit alcohol dehydrogenase family)